MKTSGVATLRHGWHLVARCQASAGAEGAQDPVLHVTSRARHAPLHRLQRLAHGRRMVIGAAIGGDVAVIVVVHPHEQVGGVHALLHIVARVAVGVAPLAIATL